MKIFSADGYHHKWYLIFPMSRYIAWIWYSHAVFGYFWKVDEAGVQILMHIIVSQSNVSRKIWVHQIKSILNEQKLTILDWEADIVMDQTKWGFNSTIKIRESFVGLWRDSCDKSWTLCFNPIWWNFIHRYVSDYCENRWLIVRIIRIWVEPKKKIFS